MRVLAKATPVALHTRHQLDLGLGPTQTIIVNFLMLIIRRYFEGFSKRLLIGFLVASNSIPFEYLNVINLKSLLHEVESQKEANFMF